MKNCLVVENCIKRWYIARMKAAELKWDEEQFYTPQFENMALVIWPTF